MVTHAFGREPIDERAVLLIAQRLGIPPVACAVVELSVRSGRRATGTLSAIREVKILDLTLSKNWPEGRLTVAGEVVAPALAATTRPHLQLGASDIAVWYVKLEVPSGRAAAELHWPATGCESAIRLHPGAWGDKDVEAASRALRFLERLSPGGGAPTKDRAVVLDELAKLGIKWLERHPEADPSDVQERHLAEADFTTERAIYGRRSLRQPTIRMSEIRDRIRLLRN